MQLIRTYITMTHLYFTHGQEMTDEEKTKARQCFREFERHISFNGFRRAVWQRLNNYERAFATAYFLLAQHFRFKASTVCCTARIDKELPSRLLPFKKSF